MKSDMAITVTQIGDMSGIWADLQQKKVHECGPIINALNALISHPISEVRQDFSTTQLGQNKFFLNEGFQYLSTDLGPRDTTPPNQQSMSLRAVRGYYTSIL
jgi:hypothetical protein